MFKQDRNLPFIRIIPEMQGYLERIHKLALFSLVNRQQGDDK